MKCCKKSECNTPNLLISDNLDLSKYGSLTEIIRDVVTAAVAPLVDEISHLREEILGLKRSISNNQRDKASDSIKPTTTKSTKQPEEKVHDKNKYNIKSQKISWTNEPNLTSLEKDQLNLMNTIIDLSRKGTTGINKDVNTTTPTTPNNDTDFVEITL
ncbi:hypothetical protein Zmor_021403 [Zophobas morio]|uniref:Uncharacterized protein n=1 Tax=Zophobas morio TaxID=2755281 RepID=A0AA38I7T4_9CUCU|nr:hypothetical protein Zmor_021403 [Zophobas morio]